jgi:hypothetical protein
LKQFSSFSARLKMLTGLLAAPSRSLLNATMLKAREESLSRQYVRIENAYRSTHCKSRYDGMHGCLGNLSVL